MQTSRCTANAFREKIEQIFFPYGSCVFMIEPMPCNQTGDDLLTHILRVFHGVRLTLIGMNWGVKNLSTFSEARKLSLTPLFEVRVPDTN
jgi:hypothetical protein